MCYAMRGRYLAGKNHSSYMWDKIEFDNDGYLKEKLFFLEKEAFLEAFCSSPERVQYREPAESLLHYAHETGAQRIIFGGSFVTQNKSPRDVDCIIVYKDRRSVPLYNTCVQSVVASYDILFGSEDNPAKIESYINVFSLRRTDDRRTGLVDLWVSDEEPRRWSFSHFNPNIEEVRRFIDDYYNRCYIERNQRRGILILIHGVNTNAKWISQFTTLANLDGWIVAPYIYDASLCLLASCNMRVNAVTKFRKWLNELCLMTGENRFSVVAHSFGTYLTTKYIDGCKNLDDFPVVFDKAILVGSIVDPKYKWSEIPNNLMEKLLIITTNNDFAVKLLTSKIIRSITREPLFGPSAIGGFTTRDERVRTLEWNIITHCDVFDKDSIKGVFFNFLDNG